jgi:hypothetical protein
MFLWICVTDLCKLEIYCICFCRAYSFLWQSGNSDILLRQAKLEGSSAPDIIATLEEHFSYINTECAPTAV